MWEDGKILPNLSAPDGNSKTMADDKTRTNLRLHRNPTPVDQKIEKLEKPPYHPHPVPIEKI
jgi:hypothetical protein